MNFDGLHKKTTSRKCKKCQKSLQLQFFSRIFAKCIFVIFFLSFFLEGYFGRPSPHLNSQEILSNTLNYYATTGRQWAGGRETETSYDISPLHII